MYISSTLNELDSEGLKSLKSLLLVLEMPFIQALWLFPLSGSYMTFQVGFTVFKLFLNKSIIPLF